MITPHLTDTEIQVYVTEPGMTSNQLERHIQDCTHCHNRASNYKLLFNGIHHQAKPQFNFDLAALVMEQLPAPKQAFPWAGVLILVFSVLLISISTMFFWSAINAVIRKAPLLIIATALTAAVVTLIFQALAMIKNHQKQVHILLNAKSLQL